MDYVSNQEPQIKEMLKEIGVKDFSELIEGIPNHMLCEKPEGDDGMSECEGAKFMEALAEKNTFKNFDSYLGAGAYEHYVPAMVAAICSRGEFLTAYTPYQPEASQGGLQATFEYQSSMCALTGMDVSNAGVYDAASACAEAVLMALRSYRGKRKKVLVAESIHPHYRKVLDLYLKEQELEIVSIPFTKKGALDADFLQKHCDETTAALLLQSPNFFGCIEEAKALFAKVKEYGAVAILCSNPMAYGVYASAGDCGADIAVGDTQPFGISLSFGGPYVGYVCCSDRLLRQLPGRIVGETKDVNGKRAFVLTLQAREQHIRREKATSNICTSQSLASFASLISMLWYGKKGIPELALTNYQRAAYLREHLCSLPCFESYSGDAVFNEFAVKLNKPIEGIMKHFRTNKIEPGLELGRYYPALKNHLLIAVTEMKDKEQLDKFIEVAKGV
jgi:glycine dehydrogenase subunit 1